MNYVVAKTWKLVILVGYLATRFIAKLVRLKRLKLEEILPKSSWLVKLERAAWLSMSFKSTGRTKLSYLS